MQRIHGTAEFDEQAVARGLDDPPIMPGDARIDQLGPNCFEPFERALLTPREGGRVEPVRPVSRTRQKTCLSYRNEILLKNAYPATLGPKAFPSSDACSNPAGGIKRLPRANSDAPGALAPRPRSRGIRAVRLASGQSGGALVRIGKVMS